MATKVQETNNTPTGCFKCGRPGHWSRDCPVKPGNGPGAVGGSSTVQDGSRPGAERGAIGGGDRLVGKGSAKWKPSKGSATEEAVVKVPRKRPQLTADLLLSDNGLGYLLEKMPLMVKIRGKGHEVHDLKNLLEGYVHWHSQLHPYLGFNDFVGKVEKLGATKRVRMCVRELRDKVTSGVAPDVNQEADREISFNEAARPTLERATSGEAGRESEEWLGADTNEVDEVNTTTDRNEVDEVDTSTDPVMPVNEDEFEDFFRQGTIEPNEIPTSGQAQADCNSTAITSPDRKIPSLLDENRSAVAHTSVTISETLAARMEANRLKALERAKARHATQPQQE